MFMYMYRQPTTIFAKLSLPPSRLLSSSFLAAAAEWLILLLFWCKTIHAAATDTASMYNLDHLPPLPARLSVCLSGLHGRPLKTCFNLSILLPFGPSWPQRLLIAAEWIGVDIFYVCMKMFCKMSSSERRGTRETTKMTFALFLAATNNIYAILLHATKQSG
jgi:hypothetical protein